MKTEIEEWEYCHNCDKHVIAEYSSTSYVGQYGTNVDLVVHCPDCEQIIRTKLIDKDI